MTTPRLLPTALLCVLAPIVAGGCASDSPRATRVAEGDAPALQRAALGEVTYDEDGSPEGLHNFRRWSERVAQGGGPEGDEAFANLARLGYRTVLSVDGARPQVELAEAHGLRYVHVPIGYDGLTPAEELLIVKAVQVSDGPVYVHCHHGKHRGPAAAQIARIAVDGVSRAQAVSDLAVSGCSPDYPGLFRSIETFVVPGEEQLAQVGELPSAVVPEGIVGLMAHVDERWDYVVASRAAAWGVPARYPDIDPAHEVGMIENSLRELLDLELGAAAREPYLEHARAAQASSAELERALRAGESGAAEAAFLQLKASCKDCHTLYRN